MDVRVMLDRTIAYLTRFAGPRVHCDEIASHAGLAVATALVECRDRALVFTYACRAAKSILLNELKRNAQYVHAGPAYWAAIVAPAAAACDPAPTPREAAEAGATIRQLMRRFGLTFHQARKLKETASARTQG